jgi:hypothetical protein
VDHCLTGFIRIVTNPRIFVDPAPTADAFGFVTRLRGAGALDGSARPRPPGRRSLNWPSRTGAIKANLVPDAYLAALAISHGCRVATAD